MAQKSPEATRPTKSVLEAADEGYQTGTSAGTSAAAVPATVRSERKGITIQNQHATAKIYWAAPKPQDLNQDLDKRGTSLERKKYLWAESGSGTNEWYVVLNDGSESDPSLSTPVFFYSVKGTTETSRTEASAGSLTVNTWDYGNTDTLGFNTIYYRPPAGETPYGYYNKLLSYDRMPTTSGAQTGHRLGPGDSVDVNLTADARTFIISDTATTLVVTIEYT